MNFDDLIDRDDLSEAEETRLRRVHDLLVAAGPPPELSPELLRAPAADAPRPPAEVAFLPRRRWRAAAVLALAATVAAFAGGYAFGHWKARPEAFTTVHSVPMHGPGGRRGVIEVGPRDAVGNWPMLVSVRGLPEQRNRASYYELWLTRGGKPIAPCGSFRVHGKTTNVRFSVPYTLRGFDGWVVTAEPADASTPGPVVLTT